MKTIKKTETLYAPAEKVFRTRDHLDVTGMQMTASSAMMMGCKLDMEYLNPSLSGRTCSGT